MKIGREHACGSLFGQISIQCCLRTAHGGDFGKRAKGVDDENAEEAKQGIRRRRVVTYVLPFGLFRFCVVSYKSFFYLVSRVGIEPTTY